MELYGTVKKMFGNVEIEEIPHEEFKKRTRESKVVVRTGESKPYANIILESGVTF